MCNLCEGLLFGLVEMKGESLCAEVHEPQCHPVWTAEGGAWDAGGTDRKEC